VKVPPIQFPSEDALHSVFFPVKKIMDTLVFCSGSAAAMFAVLWNKLDSFLFHPIIGLDKTPKDIGLEYKDVLIKHKDFTLHGWWLQGKGDKVIIFSHGNAGNLVNRLHFLDFWAKYLWQHCSLVIYDYPGFGNSVFTEERGTSSTILKVMKPTVDSCKESLRLCIDKVRSMGYKTDNIILYGESIGGGITTAVAYEYVVKGKHFDKIVLQSSFTSLTDMISKLFPITLPFLYFVKDPLPSLDYVKWMSERGGEKIVIMHSPGDQLIPFTMAKKMQRYSKNFVILTGDHNDTRLDEKAAAAIIGE
jgi:uncharacterized protein